MKWRVIFLFLLSFPVLATQTAWQISPAQLDAMLMQPEFQKQLLHFRKTQDITLADADMQTVLAWEMANLQKLKGKSPTVAQLDQQLRHYQPRIWVQGQSGNYPVADFNGYFRDYQRLHGDTGSHSFNSWQEPDLAKVLANKTQPVFARQWRNAPNQIQQQWQQQLHADTANALLSKLGAELATEMALTWRDPQLIRQIFTLPPSSVHFHLLNRLNEMPDEQHYQLLLEAADYPLLQREAVANLAKNYLPRARQRLYDWIGDAELGRYAVSAMVRFGTNVDHQWARQRYQAIANKESRTAQQLSWWLSLTP